MTPLVITSLSLLTVLLAVMTLTCLALWKMHQSVVLHLTKQLKDLQLQNSNLLNRVQANDPWSYQLLQATGTPQQSASEYVPTGTDTDEYKRWQELNPGAEEWLDDDTSELLADAGLVSDDAGGTV